MSKFGQLIPEKIEMLHFAILKGGIDCPLEHTNEKVSNFEYNVDFELAYNLDELIVKTDLEIHVETKSKDQEEATGAFHFAYWFQVDNLKELIIKNEKEEIVSPHLGNALASITYSTSRGILMTRFQGTALSNFILPITDPNELLKS